MQQSHDQNTSALVLLAAWGIGALALWLHARSYPVLTYDDAFISLRYSERLLDGQGLTWTDGPRVEGYSNLLWVLGCAFLGAVGFDLLDTPVILGTASAIAAVGALVVAFAPTSFRDSLPAFATALFLALAGPIGMWAVAGLEGCLVAALLAWALVAIRPLVADPSMSTKRAWIGGVPLGLLCLTRPDGPLLAGTAIAFVWLWSRSRPAFRQAVSLAVFPTLAVLGQLAFRLAYYGDWLPNTARAKVAFTSTRVADGAECVADAGAASYALWVPALFSLYVAWREPSRRARIALVFTMLVVWTAYVAGIVCQPYGFRMLIPSVVMLAFLVGELFDWAQRQGPRVAIASWATAAALLTAFTWMQRAEPGATMAREHRPPATQKGAAIGTALKTAFGSRDPLLAVDAAGVIPYYADMRALDMLGLNDAHIATTRGAEFGEGTQGHELGDGDYVLSRAPDLILTGTLGQAGPRYRGGREMQEDPRFASLYRRVLLQADEPAVIRFYAFMRIDGPLGIDRSDGVVRIPGVLFAREKDTVASLVEGAFETRFLRPAATTLSAVPLDRGTWNIELIGDGDIEIMLRSKNQGRTIRGNTITVGDDDNVDITLFSSEPATVRQVVARRASPTKSP